MAKKTNKKPIVLPVVLIVGVLVAWQIVASLTGFLSHRWFADQITVAIYNPTGEIVDLADGSGMNDTGKFYFYASIPSLNTAHEFNINCADVMDEHTTVLGCYTGQIYIFDVTDDRIAGAKYVTAAHEMLHAAYDRLGPIEKLRIDNLIDKQLERTADDRILELVRAYDQSEPGQRLNELHSIFGTEVRDLLPELSEYYDRYFSDREKSILSSEQYLGVFYQLEKQAADIEEKMILLESEIEVLTADYEAGYDQLSIDIDSFNATTFTSEAELNWQRNNLIYRSNQLDSNVDIINFKIDQYNQYIDDLQSLGREAVKLQNSLDSQSNFIYD